MPDKNLVFSNSDEMPWVLTKVKDSVCALDSNYVEAIYLLDEEITRTPGSDNIHVGVVKFRNSILPLIDLRQKLGIISRENEQEAFEEMLEQRKQDHIHWVDELKRCAEENDSFKLATDPHKCAFGQWYDTYTPVSACVSFHLRKIDEPHKKLHACANEMVACQKICDECQRAESLHNIIENQSRIYMTRVLQLLEEAKQVFRDSYHKMVVVLADGNSSYGILVDEVLSVEKLAKIKENNNLIEVGDQHIVRHVAQRKSSSELILVLDKDKLVV